MADSADEQRRLTLQRPLPNGALRIVARGDKQDGPRQPLARQIGPPLASEPLRLLPGANGRCAHDRPTAAPPGSPDPPIPAAAYTADIQGRQSSKLSLAPDSILPITPGISRTQASSTASAATSPPDST